MFNLGELRDVLHINKLVKATNDLGMSTNKLQSLYKLRCKKKIQSSKEYINANRDTESVTVKFLVYTRRAIHLDHVVTYKGEQYNIKHIDPYMNGYVELVCEVRR